MKSGIKGPMRRIIEYSTLVFDCFCLDNETVIFWEEVDDASCVIYQLCECVSETEEWNENTTTWISSQQTDNGDFFDQISPFSERAI